jgi:D-alanine transaminase
MELAMVNDLIVPIEEARISAHDRGLYFGDGVYEVIASRGGKLFALERHLKRLEYSLGEMQMREKVDVDQIRLRVNKAFTEAGIADAKVYFHITRGRALRAHEYTEDWQPNFLLTVRKMNRMQVDSASVITHPDWRWKRCDIKSLNLLANVLAKHAAKQAGATEAILVDEKQMVTEGTSTSVLMIQDGVLRTTPLRVNILAGITRALILEWAGEVGLEVREESFTVAEALQGDELFLTGTTTEVLGITQLDGNTLGNGSVGKYTRQFKQRLDDTMNEGME